MISFRLKCPTAYGQNVYVLCENELHPMTYDHDGIWICQIDMKVKTTKGYSYILEYADGSREIDTPKYRFIPKHQDNVLLEDEFSHRSLDTIFQSKAFTECITKPYHYHPYPVLKSDEALTTVFAPGISPEHGVAVVGEDTCVGSWNPEHMLRFVPTQHGWWWLKLPTKLYRERAEFKFIIYDRATKKVVQWEEGDNRRLPEMSPGKVFSSTMRMNYNWHGSGVSIPVFSLRTATSWGVGEFQDLKKMGDWAAKHGHKLIQILPINDTTATKTEKDSYPYRANSVHALHPMYLHVPEIGDIKDKQKQKDIIERAKKLNALPEVDYVAVNRLKWEYIEQYYSENYSEIVYSKDFKAFVKANEYWIKDYAVFSCIRDKYENDNFNEWNDGAAYSVELRDKYIKFHKYGVSLYYFVQFQLHKQLMDAIEYLHSIGVVLKGDMPIGVSPFSVDAWVAPNLFNLDKSAGAPPDDFSDKGQNWGFPTYNWDEMAKDDYAWWKSRFMTMDRYFDVFRIDHILGFFRIWEIPNHAIWGLLGHFNPALPLSEDEINSLGINFDYNRYVRPYVTKEKLETLFAGESATFINRYFKSVGPDRYDFQPAFSTQRAIYDSFRHHKNFNERKGLMDKLLSLLCDVIFIEDDKKPGYYHPRINMTDTDSFAALPQYEQEVLRKVYDDFFYKRHNAFWKKEAFSKLPPLLNTTDMLVCGEDLGMVPACVPEVMKLLQVLSLEVQRMPKSEERYIDTSKTPYLSVCTTGTHDTSTLRSWWHEDRQKTQWYYNNVLNRKGDAPAELPVMLAKAIIEMHLNSSSMWTIIPWQDYMACDAKNQLPDADKERINDPSNPDQVWCWRMHKQL